jgi:hypothetical protein
LDVTVPLTGVCEDDRRAVLFFVLLFEFRVVFRVVVLVALRLAAPWVRVAMSSRS